MNIIEIIKTIKINKLTTTGILLDFILKEGELYLFDDWQVYNYKNLCHKILIPLESFSKIHEVEEIIKEFNYNSKSKNVIIHRSGGIGDIIALSSVCNYLHEHKYKIYFITKTIYKPLFKWFKVPVTLIDIEKPLPFKNDLNHNQDYSLLEYEGKVESSKKNWYNTFFKSFVGIDFNIYGKPDLRRKSIFHFNNLKSYSILFCLKASANIRSIDLETVYKSLQIAVKNKKINIYIHEINLSLKDLHFALDNKNKINIIPKSDIKHFLNDCYNADLVISTDTGILHFREGIKKVCLGLYNSFSSESRTKYYSYVKTIDIKSDCSLQPCFKHTFKPDDPCENKNYYCFSEKDNKILGNQLTEFFEIVNKL